MEGDRDMRKNLFWLQWKRIEPHLPTDVRGVQRVDDRRVISGIVHVLKSGCRWCDCPPEYGPATTIYNRFVRWARRSGWETLFRELAGNGRSTDTQMIDSTHVKAHRSAAGGKGGSRGADVDGLDGWPVASWIAAYICDFGTQPASTSIGVRSNGRARAHQ